MALEDAMVKAGLALRELGAAQRENAYRSGDRELSREANKNTRAGDAILTKAARGEYAEPVPLPDSAAYPLNAVKAEEERRFGLFVVYSANRLPARGADHKLDIASPDVLERACWKFAGNGMKVGIDHKPGGEHAARVVESYIHRGPAWHVVGPDGEEQVIEPGDWLVGLLFSRDAWADFKAGRWAGVSLQGTAKRKPASLETLNRQRA